MKKYKYHEGQRCSFHGRKGTISEIEGTPDWYFTPDDWGGSFTFYEDGRWHQKDKFPTLIPLKKKKILECYVNVDHRGDIFSTYPTRDDAMFSVTNLKNAYIVKESGVRMIRAKDQKL